MRPALLLAALAVVVSSLALPSAQGSNPLVGAWRITEWTIPEEPDRDNLRGLLVFTDAGYSRVVVWGDRGQSNVSTEGSDAQKAAAYDTLFANSGTYEVSGSTVTWHLEAAKNPGRQMSGTANFEIDGNTLTLTGQNGAVWKHTRVE